MKRALTAKLGQAVPERSPLQEVIAALRFKLVLDEGYAPFAHTGYLPCTLDGEDAGFDLRFSEERELVVLSLSWGGDPREAAAAYIFCAALVQSFGAEVTGEGGLSLSLAQLRAKAEAALA